KARRVHAARDRRDPRSAGRVVAEQLGALHDVCRDDPVGAPDDARLLAESERGLQLGDAAGRPILQAAQRVEHLEHRQRPALPQRERRDAGEPVVGVDEIIRRAAREAPGVDTVDELVEVRVDLGARQRRLRARREVDDARARAQGDDAWDRRVLRAREDVDLDAPAPELPGELADIHVHPARLLAPEGGERTGVDGEHRDAERAARRHWILTAQTSSVTGSNSYLYRSSPRRKSKRRFPRPIASRIRCPSRTTPGDSVARSGWNPEL